MSVATQVETAHAPYLSVSGLDAGYDGVRVLYSLDFELARGETLALLGRNGAGKSTLCTALFGLEPQVSGRIAIKGRDVSGWPGHRIARLGVALVPKGRGVYANLTVDENLRMAALWSRRRSNRRWTTERIYDDIPRLAQRRSLSSGALSGGERQLLAIARALLTQADFIVLDEPSEGLSPKAIEDVIIGTVGRLRDEGYTLLIAEQNMAMALRLAGRVLVLDHGRVAFDGPSSVFMADKDLQRGHLGL